MFSTVGKMPDRFGSSVNESGHKSGCRIFVRGATSWAYLEKPASGQVSLDEAKRVCEMMIGRRLWMKGELIDEKVDDDCTFVRNNKIRAETRVQILVTFRHVTLIISNEKFQFQSQSDCENLKCLPIPSYKNLRRAVARIP